MKKILFATTALGAVAVAAPSFAAEAPKLTVNGYVGVGMVYGDGDLATASINNNGASGNDGFGLLHDGEIHFRWSGSSDNGLTFSGEVEMEAFNLDGDEIDEYWTAVSGSFGRVMIGGDDTAYQNTSIGVTYAPLAKIGHWDGFAWTGNNPVWSYTGDSMALHYYTPDFNGFSAGVSYHPSGSSDGIANFQNPVYDKDGYGDNAITGGIAWEGEFSGLTLGFGAGYGTADSGPADEDMDAWRLDGKVGYAGLTVAALYQENRDSRGGGDAGEDLAIGAQYTTGPWTLGGGWTMGAMDTSGEYDRYAGYVTYAISPGVTGTVGIQHETADDQDDATVGAAYLAIGF